MKKFILLIFVTSIIVGCRYKDGPLISFRSAGKRLMGTWQIIEFTSNGVDSLQYCIDSCGNNFVIEQIYGGTQGDIDLSINKDNDFSKGWFVTKIELISNASLLHIYEMTACVHQLKGIGPISNYYSNYDWKILRLEMHSLRFQVDYNGRTYIMSFKK